MTDSPIFVDTGYLIALINQSDRHHIAAARWAGKLMNSPRPRITTSAILVEFADGICKAHVWLRFRSMFDFLRNDPRTKIVDVDRSLFDRALELRNARADKDWGLTDCLSFVVMQDNESTDALSCDSHFVQAGFRALLLD